MAKREFCIRLHFAGKSDVDGAMLDYCFSFLVFIEPSQCPLGCANSQLKCVNSRVKTLKNISYRCKRELLQNFKVETLRYIGYRKRLSSRQNMNHRLQIAKCAYSR